MSTTNVDKMSNLKLKEDTIMGMENGFLILCKNKERAKELKICDFNHWDDDDNMWYTSIYYRKCPHVRREIMNEMGITCRHGGSYEITRPQIMKAVEALRWFCKENWEIYIWDWKIMRKAVKADIKALHKLHDHWDELGIESVKWFDSF